MIRYFTSKGRFFTNDYKKVPFNKLHNEDGPAFVDSTGRMFWFVDGKCHRVDAPASIDADGTRRWFIDGKYHRLSGPAIEMPNGNNEWWISGNILVADEVEYWLEKNNVDLKTKKGQMLFKMKFAC